MTEEQKKYIRDEYAKGTKSIQAIANDLGLKLTTLQGYVRRARKRGEFPAEPKARVTPSVYRPRDVKQGKAVGIIYRKTVWHEPTLAEGQCVKCTKSVAKTCLYGVCSPVENGFLCDYAERTHRCRILVSPDPKKCTVYVDKRKVKNEQRRDCEDC